MKMYRTTTGTNITEHEVINAAPKFVFYRLPSGDEVKEGRRSKEWNWHETREDAVRFLIKTRRERINNMTSEAILLEHDIYKLRKELL